ncbi:hypothetical protein BR93DRAFT_978367 [Coniochaeta sp. PMI_546]|nr:hypothetical protein BR93DRAFT_978367 [Coniochaeta sp. PMI_546]
MWFQDSDTLYRAEGTLSYLAESPRHVLEKPYFCSVPLDDSQEHLRTNTTLDHKSVAFANIRPAKDQFTLEDHALQFLQLSDELVGADLGDDDALSAIQMEAISLITDVLKAEYCQCYDYRFRKGADKSVDKIQSSGSHTAPDEPARTPHIDQTSEGGWRRIKRHMPRNVQATYMNGGYRFRIVNLWRPTKGPVLDDPLVFCDPASVQREADLVSVDRVGAEYVGEVYYMKYSPTHRWYWLDQQRVDEGTAFVSFDSDGSLGLPHASVHLDGTLPDVPARESLELRLIVVTRQTGGTET